MPRFEPQRRTHDPAGGRKVKNLSNVTELMRFGGVLSTKILSIHSKRHSPKALPNALGLCLLADGPGGGEEIEAQSESALIVSPPSGVAMAYQGCQLTELLMNRTEPSMKSTLTPPGWFELALFPVIVARPS